MEQYLIANTTKEERIALIKSWVPDDEAMEDCDIDIWDMYADYINGKKEIPECNAAFYAHIIAFLIISQALSVHISVAYQN